MRAADITSRSGGHLDLGCRRLEVHARLRRLRCPEHGVHVEGVPFARDGARFTRDFEQLVAWLATKTDKTATCRLTRIEWQTIRATAWAGCLRSRSTREGRGDPGVVRTGAVVTLPLAIVDEAPAATTPSNARQSTRQTSPR